MGIMMSLTGLGDGVEKSLNLDAKMDLLLLNMEETANVSTQKLIKRRLLRVKRISSATNLPIKVLHTALTKYAQKHGTEFTAHINENTVAGFCAEFSAWKNDNLQGRFRYERSKAPLGATALTYAGEN